MFERTRLTPKEVLRLNHDEYHKAGLCLCRDCLGVFEHNEDNFYFTSKRRQDGTPILMSICRACKDANTVRKKREQYNTDDAAREKMQTTSREYWRGLSPTAKYARYLKSERAKLAKRQQAKEMAR